MSIYGLFYVCLMWYGVAYINCNTIWLYELVRMRMTQIVWICGRIYDSTIFCEVFWLFRVLHTPQLPEGSQEEGWNGAGSIYQKKTIVWMLQKPVMTPSRPLDTTEIAFAVRPTMFFRFRSSVFRWVTCIPTQFHFGAALTYKSTTTH